jgi:hypothetical protein
MILLILVGAGNIYAQRELDSPKRSIDAINKMYAAAGRQTRVMLQEVDAARKAAHAAQTGHSALVSPRTLKDGKLVLVPARDWTSGFFPGVLWYLYEHNKDTAWEAAARQFTGLIEKEKFNGTTHDMGFKIYCSFGNGYRLTHDPAYKAVIVTAAKTLSTRFNPRVGAIRSWDHNKQKWAYPVIIDNMLNLELLFEATKLTGDSSFYHIADQHATTTMKNHFRPDYSSYHVVDYDSLTGKVLQKTTHQGYSDASAWARGQAWGLYGFTMCYRETGNKAYLAQAENIARFILDNPHMPADLVPYWDFDAPNIPDEPRDVSAAAVIASGLLELSTFSHHGKYYLNTAIRILTNLGAHYRSPLGENHGFILLHSTGSRPSNSEVDVPLNYADYYYLEALQRLDNLIRQKPVLQ